LIATRKAILFDIFESAWKPNPATTKPGFFRTVSSHENVCQPGDVVEYLKGPLDGWLLLRNVSKGSLKAEWAPVECLPDGAFDYNVPNSAKNIGLKKGDTFACYHDYVDVITDTQLKRGDEMGIY
tara:strand:- start:55 stop:429 length:375 start_codon:yes stop_codon:yes gene_type:complete